MSFYIFDYTPKEEMLVREFVYHLVARHSWSGSEIKPVECDLYRLMIEILASEKIKDKSILELIPDMEKKDGTERLEKGLKSIVTPGRFVESIKEKVADKNLVLITGVGKVYPLIRSHTVLNNLHHVLDKVPVIMFYPGYYDQKELRLFNLFKDDNYYRAFKLV
ncbi:MAG: DUF1788 domain-containing protein [Vulcanimicrobiota bacterium]